MKMSQFIMVNLKIMKKMVMGYIFLKIIVHMKVILKIIYLMEKENLNGMMEENMKVILQME